MAISAQALRHAASLAGLEFTPKELRQAVERVEGYLEGYALQRAAGLRNHEAPAVRFDPRLPHVRYRPAEGGVVRSRAKAPALPEADEDIAFASVTWLAQWVERRELSSERLTAICLDRLQRYDPLLECVVTLLDGPALEAARRADREIARGRYRGPLHGIPWGAKDLLDTRGVATTWGAEPYAGRIPERDAEVVRRLEEAGAVLVAKTSLGALAYGDVWHRGVTKNPFRVDQGSSGSSAGSASAVAAGLVAFGIGTETLGSIVSPSLRCGTAGLRPTFGRVSRAGAMALCWSMDKIGPIARTVEDAALVLDAIAGPEPASEPDADPSLLDVPFGFDARRTARGLRAGYVPGAFRGKGSTKADRAALEALRASGVEVVAVRLPEAPVQALMPVLWVEAAAAFDDLTRSNRDDELRRQDDAAWPNTFRSTRFVPAVEYVQAERLRRRLMRQMHEWFEAHRLDAVITPHETGPLLAMTNFTGHPSLTLRAGFRRDGTPTGVTLYGRLFGEDALLRLGMALERRLDCWHARPRLPERA